MQPQLIDTFYFQFVLFSEGVRAALGERFRHGLVKTVQVETKGEKTDNKILVSLEIMEGSVNYLEC